jgi:Dynamin family
VVVGEQSAGKSSVLQAVTEIPFPINDNMCTRFATEIVLKRTPPGAQTEVTVTIIPDAKESEERKTLLRAWRPEGFDRKDHLTKASIENIFEQVRNCSYREIKYLPESKAEDIIFEEEEKKAAKRPNQAWAARSLSNSTLQITRSGPDENNFAIVDIPGLIRGKCILIVYQ